MAVAGHWAEALGPAPSIQGGAGCAEEELHELLRQIKLRQTK